MARAKTVRPQYIVDANDKNVVVEIGSSNGSAILTPTLTDISNLTLTDGQTFKYDATTGHIVATNPTGNSLNASASNTTNVVTTAAGPTQPTLGLGTPVLIPGTAISVTSSGGRTVRLEFEATIQQSVAGTGSVWIALAETTSGTTFRKYNIRPIPGVTTLNLNQITMGLDSVNIGVVTTTRTFALYLAVASATTTATPQVQAFNQATHPSILRAINE